MIQTLNLRGRDLDVAELREILPRPEVDVTRALAGATELINAVREHGAEALAEQAARFDGAAPEHIRVPQADIDAAVDGLDAAVRDALEEMIRRVRAGSAAQVPPPARTELADGAVVEQRWQPVDRVGLYVPGGKAVYPSSLAAAGILGVTEVYAMGGAGAIGAFAYGVADLGLAPVDVITGPGNVWVAAAKRAVSAKVGIDAEAGPTEILVIADGQANVNFVAADLLSQAEHDELAAAVLVTDSERLAGEVAERLAQLAAETKHAGRVATSLGGRQSAIVLVDDLAAACRVSNAYGPEHLELQTTDDEATLAGITNAGAIFMGGFSPVPLGDYLAGSNHVLPTGGQSAHAAGLGAYTFLRAQQIIRYDAAALDAVRPRLTAIALAEDLPAHAAAGAARAERATNERTGE
jgi:histidinol dehydrogenase